MESAEDLAVAEIVFVVPLDLAIRMMASLVEVHGLSTGFYCSMVAVEDQCSF